MGMSKMDYEIIAERIKISHDMDEMICQLAATFIEGNSRFDKQMFFAATGRVLVGDYEVNAYGQITSPGKFEGEMFYMPLAYQTHLEGNSVGYEGDCDGIWKTYIEWGGEDRAVLFFEDNVGFVHEVQEEDVLATQEGHADD